MHMIWHDFLSEDTEALLAAHFNLAKLLDEGRIIRSYIDIAIEINRDIR